MSKFVRRMRDAAIATLWIVGMVLLLSVITYCDYRAFKEQYPNASWMTYILRGNR